MYRQALCLVFWLSAANAAKILGVFMSTSYSHQIVYQPIWRELSLRGHQVTVYTPNPINDPTLTNLTEVDLSFSYEVWNKHTETEFSVRKSQSDEYQRIMNAYEKVFESQMTSPEMQDLILNRNNETYDLFLVEYIYPTMYPFKDIYKCPMVGIGSLPLTINSAASIGMKKHPVLDPEVIFSFSGDLSFKERIISTVFDFLYKFKVAASVSSKLTADARKYFGQDVRDVFEIGKDVSLVLGTASLATQNIRPLVPAFVDISGIHLKPAKPLPKGLKKILDDAKQGVIYFSLGTNVKPHHLPEKSRKYIFEAFAELPYKVFWKSEEDLGNNTNVMSAGWYPQHDILRHPNVKLFITQGGLQSIDEALTSETPMLMMPFFGDQFFNAHKMSASGVALTITFDDFTKEEFKEKINQLIKDSKFKRAAAKLAEVAYEKPIPPLESAVWYIEHVLKHDGAEHLKYKAVDMPFYKYYLLDVYIFLGFLLYLAYYVLVKIFKRIVMGYSFCRRTLTSMGVIRDYKKSQ